MAALTTTSFVSKEAVVVKVGNRITSSSSSFPNSSSLGFLNTTTTRTTRRTRAVAASFIRCEEEVVVVGGWIGRSSSVGGGGVICCWGGSRRTRDHNNNNNNSSGRRRRRGSISSSSSSVSGGGGVPNSNYVVPLDKSSCITRPLAEILRDLNKKVSDKIVKPGTNCIPWYHANRMLSFFAPGWCGEIRDVIFSDNGNVTVVYRVTIRGFDGEAHRESAGTISTSDSQIEDPVAAAEEIAFCRACARFGLGLHLYHEDETL